MKCLLLAFAFFCSTAWAHEVALETIRQEATVVRLTYADGLPFAFEAYELYLPGKDIPEQVGRTNTQGQVIFLAGQHPEWRLKAYSADGHGVDQSLKVATAPGGGVVQSGVAPPRALLLAAGLGVLFGFFGLVQLFIRKKQR